MSGQGHGGEPAGKKGCRSESGYFEEYLSGSGKADPKQSNDTGSVETPNDVSGARAKLPLEPPHHCSQRRSHVDTGKNRREPRARHTEPRKSPMPLDQQPVTKPVH